MSSPSRPVTASGDLPSGHVEHRRAFRDFVLAEAEEWHREHLGRLYEFWEEWNRRFYLGRLEPPYLLLSEPSTPQRYGDCGPLSGFGGRSQIRIRPSLLTGTHPDMQPGGSAEGRFLFVADVLLHEQIHQFHQEVTGEQDENYHGHGPAFRDTANRIGEQLGLPTVRTCKKRGPDSARPSCSQWPHNVRPEGFYLGAFGRERRPTGPSSQSPLVVTPNGDPGLVGERLLEALLGLPMDDQYVIYDVLANWYGPLEDDEEPPAE